MDHDTIRTAFMLTVSGTDEELQETLIGRQIHAGMICPKGFSEGEWAVSVVPIGIVESYERMQGMLKVTVALLHGEVDKV